MNKENQNTTIKISKKNFWALEGYRVLNKLSSKDEAIEKLLKKSKENKK